VHCLEHLDHPSGRAPVQVVDVEDDAVDQGDTARPLAVLAVLPVLSARLGCAGAILEGI
jgi:hypothetical protein